MKKPDRKTVHEFLQALVAGLDPHEQVAMMKDIMVDEFCFNGIPEEMILSDLEAQVEQGMKQDAGKKISWIKTVREKTGLGLKEAKEYVESLTPGHPLYGQSQYRNVNTEKRSITSDQYLEGLASRLNKIARDYNKPEPF